MNAKRWTDLRRYRLLLTLAIDYGVGYEFPVWAKNDWGRGWQYKLDWFFHAHKSEI